jgi:hypothetical protein
MAIDNSNIDPAILARMMEEQRKINSPNTTAPAYGLTDRSAPVASAQSASLAAGEEAALAAQEKAGRSDMGRGALNAMNSGASIGGTVTSAGLMGMIGGATAGPYALAAGLGISALESHQKAKLEKEKARIRAIEQQKLAEAEGINQLIGITRQLGVVS